MRTLKERLLCQFKGKGNYHAMPAFPSSLSPSIINLMERLEGKRKLWNSLERFDERRVTATVVGIDRSLALTVSLKQSPGGGPLCCKTDAVVLLSRGPDTPETAPPRARAPVCGAHPATCATESKVGNAGPHSAVLSWHAGGRQT